MKQKTALCYSEVFKCKVVKEIEDGVLTISESVAKHSRITIETACA